LDIGADTLPATGAPMQFVLDVDMGETGWGDGYVVQELGGSSVLGGGNLKYFDMKPGDGAPIYDSASREVGAGPSSTAERLTPRRSRSRAARSPRLRHRCVEERRDNRDQHVDHQHHPVVGIGIHVLGHAAQLVTQRAVDEPLLSKVTSRVERRYAPTSIVATQATAP
jgi:hypothetical protein